MDARKERIATVLSQAIEDGELTADDMKTLLENLGAMSYRSAAPSLGWITISDRFKYRTDGVVGAIVDGHSDQVLPFWSLRPSNLDPAKADAMLELVMLHRHGQVWE